MVTPQPAMMATPMDKVEPTPAPRRFIAPPSSEARQLKEHRAARLKALRSVLQLRAVDITLYDSAPLTPYELHTRHASTKRVKMVQTGDDDVSIGVQTEEIETDVCACQWPEDGNAPGKSSSLEASASAQTATLLTANIGRLRRFLGSAGQVVETLCSENLMAAASGADAVQQPNALPFSTRHTLLQLPAALGERAPHDLVFDSSGGALLVAYGKPLNAEPPAELVTRKRDVATLRRLAAGGCLALWKIYAPEMPWAVMRCAGVPSCCLVPEAKPHLAFAGTEEGAVQLWNMREPGASHPAVELGDKPPFDRVHLRSPTYASDCLAMTSHMSPVVALMALPVSGDAEDTALSISSLDVEGTLIVWLVLEAVELDALDLGQAVGGKERLLMSGSTSMTEGVAALAPAGGGGARAAATARASVLPTRCVHMTFVPSDPSRLLVGTDLAQVLHRSRYTSSPPMPEAYEPGTDAPLHTDAPQSTDAPLGTDASQLASGVTSIAFHPRFHSYFLVGREDGSVALCHLEDRHPLRSFVGFAGGAVVQVCWCPARPSVFWALDADDRMHIFDLLHGKGMPDVSCPVTTSGRADSPTRRVAGAGAAGAAARRTSSDPDDPAAVESARRMRFALDARSDSASTRVASAGARQRLAAITCRGDERLSGVEVHVLVERYAAAEADELTKLEHVLDQL